MAQEIRTPRFYVSVLQWLDAMGLMEYDATSYLTHKTPKQLVNINPASQARFTIPESEIGNEKSINFTMHYETYKKMMPNDKNFMMLLGHNFGSSLNFQSFFKTDNNTSLANTDPTDDVGYSSGTHLYNGVSISHGNDAHDADTATIKLSLGSNSSWNANYGYRLGSVLYGTYYDMPHASDLSTMSIEMDGVKNITTKGGSTLSNASYTKAPDWGDLGAWNVAGYDNLRHGRRSWSLSFSYLSSDDIMAKVAADTNIGAGDFDISDSDNVANTLRTESDWFSVVWNRCIGGHLPFVFLPNKDNNSPDQFAICRFDQSSLKINQTAPTLYQISVKIRECW